MGLGRDREGDRLIAIGTPTALFTAGSPGSSTTNNTTVTLATTVAGSAGSLIIAVSTSRTASAVTCTFSGGGLTWNAVDFNNAAATGGVTLGWAQDASGLASGTTITATWSASSTRKGLTLYKVTGLDTSTPHDTTVGVDKANSGTSGSASATSTASTAQADEIIFFLAKHNAATGSVTGTASAGYTELDDFIVGASTFLQQYLSYKIASATETPSPSVTYSDTTTNWQAGVIAFKMAAAAGNITLTPTVATATADGIVPGVLAALAPIVAASTGAALAPVLKVTLVPTVAAATASVVAPVPTASLAPTVAAATAAGIVPFIKIDVRLLPTVAAATADAVAPALKASVAPTVAAASAAAVTPVLSASIAPLVATATAAAIVPAFQSGIFINPPIATATADGVTPALKASLAPTIATATAAAITPALLTSLAPTVGAATAAAIVPGLRASLAPVVAAATATALAPALRASLAPTVASGTAAALAPALKVSLAPLVAAATATAVSPSLAIALAPSIATASADAVIPTVTAQSPVALLTVHLATHPAAAEATVHANAIRIIPTPGEQTLVTLPDGQRLVIAPDGSLYVQPAATLVCVLGYSNQTSPTNIPALEASIGRTFTGLRQNQQYTVTSISTAITEYDAGRTFSYRSIQFNTAPGGWAAAATGTFDSQLVTFCNLVTAANRWTAQNPFWVCLHHEATTSGGVFGTAGFSAADYKAMWAHCVPVMLATGAPIAFAYVGWDRMFVGANGVGPPTAGQGFDDLDPGTALYTRIGSDPYNQPDSPGVLRYGTDAATLLDPIRTAALARGMDWMMGEMGCQDGATQADHTNKAAWLDSLRSYVDNLGAYGPGVCRAVLTTQETGSLYNWDSSSDALAAGVRFGGDSFFS